MSRRKPGLWLPTIHVEVEEVRKAHRKPCADCQGIPLTRRLTIKRGAGRARTQDVYCMECGEGWLRERVVEGARAITFLQTGEGCIRE